MKPRQLPTCLLLLSGALLLATAGPATGAANQPVDVAQIVAGAPGEADYPHAEAVILYQNVEFTVAEGRLTRRVHQLQKIFTEWGCGRLADLRLGWDSSWQELVIHTCRTYMRDGQVVDTPPRGFNEVTPDGVAACTDLLTQRQMVVSHLGVERGCVIELDYEVRDLQAGPYPPSGLEFLQGERPILCKRVSLCVPAGTPFHFSPSPSEPGGPVSERKDGQQIVTWTLHDLPGLPLEGQAGRRGDLHPYLVFSTWSDWDTLARTVYLERGNQAIVLSQTMKDWGHQVSSGEGEPARPDLTPLDTVNRVAEMVGSLNRTAHGPVAFWDRAPRPTDAVFAGACGDYWEQTLLAVGLLREARLRPVGVAAFCGWQDFPREVPTLLPFTELRVLIRVDGQEYWLDPENGHLEHSLWEFGGTTGVGLGLPPPLDPGSGGGLRLATPFQWVEVPGAGGGCDLSVALRPGEPDGWQADIDFQVSGRIWYPGRQTAADDLAAELASAVLEDGQVQSVQVHELSDQRLHLRVSATAEQLGEEEDGLIYLSLPRPPLGIADALPAAFRLSDLSRRSTLFLETDGELAENLHWRLLLPAGQTATIMPADIRYRPPAEMADWPAGLSQECRLEDGVVTVERKIVLPGGSISPEDYPEFRRLVARAAAPASARIVIGKE